MEKRIMHIDVKIAYEQGRKLARAYNRAMNTATTEWVLLLDWDLFACNPFWYDMCVRAIKELEGAKVGCITCVTNRIGNPGQKASDAPQNDDIMAHMRYAKRLYALHGDEVVRFKGALSGFFILTNKTAWLAAGGFDEVNRKKLNGVDNNYSRDVQRAGFKLYGMPGLYYYHIYKRKTLIKWDQRPV